MLCSRLFITVTKGQQVQKVLKNKKVRNKWKLEKFYAYILGGNKIKYKPPIKGTKAGNNSIQYQQSFEFGHCPTFQNGGHFSELIKSLSAFSSCQFYRVIITSSRYLNCATLIFWLKKCRLSVKLHIAKIKKNELFGKLIHTCIRGGNLKSSKSMQRFLQTYVELTKLILPKNICQFVF